MWPKHSPRHDRHHMLGALATTGLVMGPATGLVGPGGSWNCGAPVRLSLGGTAIVQGWRKAFDFSFGPDDTLPYRKQTAGKVGGGGWRSPDPDDVATFSHRNQEAVNCFVKRMKQPLDKKENALVRSAVGDVSRTIYESDARSKANEASIEKTAVYTANKLTSSLTIFSTGVTGVVSVACSLLARTYLRIGTGGGGITLLQCASFSFVITAAF